ncbi:MAG: hypothetical protein AAF558_12505 [Verrucomicrobiota bacterium]
MKWLRSLDPLELIWWLIVLGHLFAIWWMPVFVSQDGSAHVYTASVFNQLLFSEVPVLDRVYQIHAALIPNWVGSGLMSLFIAFFGVDGGEKMVVSVYLVGFAVGFQSVLLSLKYEQRWGKFLVLPLLFNHYLFMGLYSYLLALAGSLFVFAYAYSCLGQLNWKRAGVICLGFLAVYFTHLIPAVLCGVALVAVFAARSYFDSIHRSEFLRRGGFLVVAGLPSALLAMAYIFGGDQSDPIVWGRAFGLLVKELGSTSFLVPYQKDPLIWTMLCLVLIVVGVGVTLFAKTRNRLWGVGDVWLFLSVCVVAVMWITPEGPAGGSLISYRLGVYLWITLLLWISAQNLNILNPKLPVLAIVFALAGICQTVYCGMHQAQLQPVVDQLRKAAQPIPEGSEVWPIIFNLHGKRDNQTDLAPRNPLFSHIGLRPLAYQNDVAARIAYQGEVPHFSVHFRPEAKTHFFYYSYEDRSEDYPLLKEIEATRLDEVSPPVFVYTLGRKREELPEGSPIRQFLEHKTKRVHEIESDLGVLGLYRVL